MVKRKKQEKEKKFGRNEKQWGCGSVGRNVTGMQEGSPGVEPKHLIKPGTVVHPNNTTTQETWAGGSDILGHIQLANSKLGWVT